MKTLLRTESVFCRYQYDALDRLAASTPGSNATVQRIYQKNRLSVEIQGAVHRRVMQFDDHVLAEQRATDTMLPATDLQGSVLHSVDVLGQHDIAYSPYGHRPSGSDVFSLLGFTGERPDPVTGHYPLGKGYRSYNPVLMRFNQPDSLSPFGEGGVNAHAYCQGDPVNRSDPTGHMFSVTLRPVSDRPPAPKAPTFKPSWVENPPLRPVAEREIGSPVIARTVELYSTKTAEQIVHNATGHYEKEFEPLEAARIALKRRLENLPTWIAAVEREIKTFSGEPQPAPHKGSTFPSDLEVKIFEKEFREHELQKIPLLIERIETEIRKFTDNKKNKIRSG